MYCQILTIHETFKEFCNRYPRLDISVMGEEEDGVVSCWITGNYEDMKPLILELDPCGIYGMTR